MINPGVRKDSGIFFYAVAGTRSLLFFASFLLFILSKEKKLLLELLFVWYNSYVIVLKKFVILVKGGIKLFL